MVVSIPMVALAIAKAQDGTFHGKRQGFFHRGADEKSLLDEVLRCGRVIVGGLVETVFPAGPVVWIPWLDCCEVWWSFLPKRAAL
jgi:hypothetical protein